MYFLIIISNIIFCYKPLQKKLQPLTNTLYLGNVCISARILDLYLFISDVFTVFTICLVQCCPQVETRGIKYVSPVPQPLGSLCYTLFTTKYEI